MAQFSRRPGSQAGRNTRLALFGVVLVAVGAALSPWTPIVAILGGVILLAFAFGWMARVIIAGEVETVFWLGLFVVGVMTLPLDSVARRVVGLALMVSGISWIVWRGLRSEREQA